MPKSYLNIDGYKIISSTARIYERDPTMFMVTVLLNLNYICVYYWKKAGPSTVGRCFWDGHRYKYSSKSESISPS